jgi:DNA-binding beta-propeller fold protein YncE
MRARLVVLIGAFAAAATGCANRDRINPFDPANGTTAGRPAGFVALASDQAVQLRWQSVIGEGLIGFQIFRRTAAEPVEHAITATLPLTTTQYVDLGLANDLDHFYSIYYVFDRGIGTEPATDVATPGHRVPWMADAGSGALARLTADARRVAERRSLLSPNAVVIDTISHVLWTSDAGGGQVGILDLDTGIFTTAPNFATPGEIAAQTADNTAWVCDEGRGEVVHLDARGGRRLPTLGNLDTPTGVAIDPVDGSLWVCERNGDHVRRYASNGAILDSVFVVRPSRVAVDPVTRRAWVTSATQQQVSVIAPGGTVEHTYAGFAGPVGIQVDERRGTIWIADPNADRVTVLQRDGSVFKQIAGMPGARSLSIDRETGEVWVALAGSGEIAWLSSSGTVIRRLGGFTLPFGVAILP